MRIELAFIVPVYNTEKYLKDFIESIKRQTDKRFRVYFIDDCSDDDSYNILREVVKNADGWQVYRNQKRMGAAYSRNLGIEVSEENYIHCLDADDVVSPELVEEIYRVIEEKKPDMIMIERDSFIDGDAIIEEKLHKKIWPVDEYSVLDFNYCLLARSRNGTCDRVLARSLINKYEVRFQDLLSSNDVFYIIYSSLVAQKIVHTYTYKVLYHQRIHFSHNRISTNRDPMNAYKALKAVYDRLIDNNQIERYGNVFWQYVMLSIQDQMKMVKDRAVMKDFFCFMREEGFISLGIGSEVFNKVLSKEYVNVFSTILEKDFEDEYISSSFYLRALCNEKKEIVFNKIRIMREDNKKIALWGLGNYSISFLDVCFDNGYEFDYLIDSNSHISEYKGRKVYQFNQIDNVDSIIVTSNYYFDDIYNQIIDSKKTMEVINMIDFLYD